MTRQAIIYEGQAFTSIYNAADRIVNLVSVADDMGIDLVVHLIFNDIAILCDGDSSAEDIVDTYWRMKSREVR